MVLSLKTDELDEAWEKLATKYPSNFSLEAFRDSVHQTTMLRVTLDTGKERWIASHKLDDYELAKLDNPVLAIADFERRIIWPLIVTAGEGQTGKYPFIRLWADRHMAIRTKLFCKPNQEIPGFVFPRFNSSNKEWPKHGEVDPLPKAQPQSAGTHNGPGVLDLRAPKLKERDSDIDSNIKYPEISDKEKKQMAKAAIVKKKVVVKKPTIDPRKVKKPNCAKHEQPMEFDAVSQKWRCGVDGCIITAKPKNAAEDRSVTIGKGGLQMRLIFTKGGVASVLLVSDDNVAVNITELVDVDYILSTFEVQKFADVADQEGRDTFLINVEKPVPLKIPLTVMGNEEFQVSDYRK